MTESEFKSLTEEERWELPSIAPSTVPCDVWLRNRKKATVKKKPTPLFAQRVRFPLSGYIECECGFADSTWTLRGSWSCVEVIISGYDIVALRED